MRYFTKVMSDKDARKEIENATGSGNFYLKKGDSLDIDCLLPADYEKYIKINWNFVKKVEQEMLPLLKDDQVLRVRYELTKKEIRKQNDVEQAQYVEGVDY